MIETTFFEDVISDEIIRLWLIHSLSNLFEVDKEIMEPIVMTPKSQATCWPFFSRNSLGLKYPSAWCGRSVL